MAANSNGAAPTARTQQALLTRLAHHADRLAFSWDVRRDLYKHLSAQVGNKVPMERALETFRGRLQRSRRVSCDKIVADIARRMRDGATLTNALSPWIPIDEVSILNSGELSGNLPRALDLLVETKRRVARVVKAMKSALKKPFFYFVVIYGFIWYLATEVFPQLRGTQTGAPTGAAAWLYAIGDLANSPWALVPPLLFATVSIAVVVALPRWRGKSRIKAERYFPFSAYRDVQGYAWLMGFTALLRAGMADVAVLKTQSQHASPWLNERLRALWWRMDDGASLSKALLAKGRGNLPPFGFPNPDIVDDIASMDGFDDFADRITKVATEWSEELEEELLVTAGRIGFWAEMVLYAVVLFLLYAINQMTPTNAIAGM